MKKRHLKTYAPEIWIRAVFFRMAPLDEATKNRLWQQLEEAGLWWMTEDLVKSVAQEIVEQLSQHGRGPSFLEIDREFKSGRYQGNPSPMNTYDGLGEATQGTSRGGNPSCDAEDIAIFQFRVHVAEMERICHREVLSKAEADAMLATLHRIAKVAESFGISLKRLFPRDEVPNHQPAKVSTYQWAQEAMVHKVQPERISLARDTSPCSIFFNRA